MEASLLMNCKYFSNELSNIGFGSLPQLSKYFCLPKSLRLLMASKGIFVISLQEAEIKKLFSAIDELKKGKVDLTDDFVTPELEKLCAENSKLKYQIGHLKQVSESQRYNFANMIFCFPHKICETESNIYLFGWFCYSFQLQSSYLH